MRIEARKLLSDMQCASALLTEFTAGKMLADYERDAITAAGTRSISQNKLAPRPYRGDLEFAGVGGTTS
jgi:hypothetical protein